MDFSPTQEKQVKEDAARRLVQQCLLTRGHGGYSSSLPFGRLLRDVLGLQIGDLTARITKTIIACRMTGGGV